MSSKPVLGYWDLRGLAEYCRMLLAYAGVDFEDKRYPIGPGPEWNRDEWLADKQSLGLDFPNLPYYIEGDIKITQSLAILRHLGRKNGLAPESEAEAIRCDMAEQEATDLTMSLINVAYNDFRRGPGAESEYEKLRGQLLEQLPTKLAPLEAFIGAGPWVAGERLTYVDFRLYEALDAVRLFSSDLCDACPNLVAYVTRFEELPAIKDYMARSEYNRLPVFGPMASVLNKKKDDL